MKSKVKEFQFIGLKKYNRAQRTAIINKLVVPLLKKELGKNLIAIAADGSYARNEDTDYSDIELMIFIKDKKNLVRGFGKILDGILIEGLFITESEYYKNTLEPNEDWYISGSDTLKAIANSGFIKKVQCYRVKQLSEKCFAAARDLLFEIQESFGKLFTAIEKNNKENLFSVLADAVMQVLKLMAFINKTPYKTLSTFVTQAKGFKIKPRGFDEFIEIIIDGRYIDLETLEERVKILFCGIEEFFTRKIGKNIYDADLSTIIKK